MTWSSFTHTSIKRNAAIIACISGIAMVVFVQQKTFRDPLPEPQPWKRISDSLLPKDRNRNETALDLKLRLHSGKKGKDRLYKWRQKQFKRLIHFREQCKAYKLQRNYDISTWADIIYSEKYNIAYRPIPKIGSTFMAQVIFLLSNARTAQIFNTPRSDIHEIKLTKLNLLTKFNFERFKNYTVLIMARNPYTRLYSAYIDKVYIINSLELCMDIYSKLYVLNNKTQSCKFDISFEEFLDYMFHFDKHVLSDHYYPIMSSDYGKQMCNHQNIKIVKQETFSEDIDNAIKAVHVKGQLYDVIYDQMNSKHTESTIGSIVKTVYKKFSSKIQKKSCLTWKDIAVKLWKSFQIQGYIHNSSKFPETEFRKYTDYERNDTLIKVILDEIVRRPLNHQEKDKQRNKAMLQAYSNVDEKIIRKIRERYAMDFDMFQYDKDVTKSVS